MMTNIKHNWTRKYKTKRDRVLDTIFKNVPRGIEVVTENFFKKLSSNMQHKSFEC